MNVDEITTLHGICRQLLKALLIKKVFGCVLALMLLVPLVAEGRCRRIAPQYMMGVCIINPDSGPCRETQKRKWREMMKAKATLTPQQFEEWKRRREQEDRFQSRICGIVLMGMVVLLLVAFVLPIRSQYPQSSKKRLKGKKGRKL